MPVLIVKNWYVCLKRKGVEAALSNPKRLLSNKVPSTSIAEANKEVLKILNENQTNRSIHQGYTKVSRLQGYIKVSHVSYFKLTKIHL